MSQMTVTIRSAARIPVSYPAPARPSLRVVAAAPRRAPQLPFTVLCTALLMAGLLSLLLLNTAMARGSYDLHDLQSRSVRLADQEQALSERIADASAPESLAAAAGAAGLVPGGPPAYLDLRTGDITGVPSPATGAAGFRVVTEPATITRPTKPATPATAKTPSTTTAATKPAATKTSTTGSTTTTGTTTAKTSTNKPR